MHTYLLMGLFICSIYSSSPFLLYTVDVTIVWLNFYLNNEIHKVCFIVDIDITRWKLRWICNDFSNRQKNIMSLKKEKILHDLFWNKRMHLNKHGKSFVNYFESYNFSNSFWLISFIVKKISLLSKSFRNELGGICLVDSSSLLICTLSKQVWYESNFNTF